MSDLINIKVTQEQFNWIVSGLYSVETRYSNQMMKSIERHDAGTLKVSCDAESFVNRLMERQERVEQFINNLNAQKS